jgi:hypothetical protein
LSVFSLALLSIRPMKACNSELNPSMYLASHVLILEIVKMVEIHFNR